MFHPSFVCSFHFIHPSIVWSTHCLFTQSFVRSIHPLLIFVYSIHPSINKTLFIYMRQMILIVMKIMSPCKNHNDPKISFIFIFVIVPQCKNPKISSHSYQWSLPSVYLLSMTSAREAVKSLNSQLPVGSSCPVCSGSHSLCRVFLDSVISASWPWPHIFLSFLSLTPRAPELLRGGWELGSGGHQRTERKAGWWERQRGVAV